MGQSYRLGQSRKVTVVEYYIRKTFNKRVVNNQILRALPGLMAIIGDESITKAFGGKSDETPRGPVNATFDPTSLQGFYVDSDGLLWHSSNPEIPLDLLIEAPLNPDKVLIKFFSTNRGRRVYQHGGFSKAFQEMHINAPPPTPERSTSKRGSTKRKRNNSGDDKPSDTNTNKPSKPENTRKASKPKPKPKTTPTATAASTRKTRATATRAAPPKKRAKDAKTTATSPTAGAEAADAKPKTRHRARTDVNRNVGRMLPPGPGPDFT